MAFYPQSKLNHQRAYQLFLQLNGKDIDAGVMPGWKIDDSESKDVRSFHDIEKAIEHLATVKTRASELNANLHDHWKVAPVLARQTGMSSTVTASWLLTGLIRPG